VERTDVDSRTVQAIVLVPTRELAIQVAEASHAIGRFRHIGVLPVYGGQAYERQLRGLRTGVHLVVGTPGRLMDHIRRGTLRLDSVRTVILDEADEMLGMGFVEDIEFILGQTPSVRQTALFSATILARIEGLARRYLREPKRVANAHETRTVPQTRQVYYETPQRRKLDALTRVLDLEAPRSAIIFCRTRRGVASCWTRADAKASAPAISSKGSPPGAPIRERWLATSTCLTTSPSSRSRGRQ
jgi:ATP-dependent RNA helicase DeaD